jgi:hypothetical protein
VTAFQRAYRLNVGSIEMDALSGVDLHALRVAFSIERDIKRHPNNCEISVYNLTPSHRSALAKLASVRVLLEAGYVGDTGVLFDGELRSARSVKEGTEFVTRITGGDGDSKCRSARINKTFSKGTPIGTVLNELGKALGVGPGNLKDFTGATLANGSKVLQRSLTLSGAVFDEMEHVTRSCGLQWSIQDSALQIREAGLPVGDRQGPLLRRDSGLIGTVEVETVAKAEPGFAAGSTKVTGVCLLRHDLIPGVPMRVEQEAFTGNLVATATHHMGDSHSVDSWSIEWTGRPYK